MTVWRVAAALLRDGEHAAEPFLSYDGVVDKLAWAVPIVGPDPDGVVFVAGTAAWRVSPGKNTSSTG